MKDLRLKKAIDGYLIARAADGFSDRSFETSEWALTHPINYTGNIELSKININILRGYMNHVRREYKPNRPSGDTSPLANANIDHIWATIRAFFHFVETEFGVDRPDKNMPRP